MRLDIFELELLFEIINYVVFIHTILASVHVSGDKSALRESVNTDMALGNDNKTAPSTWILYVIIRRRNNQWLREWAHAKSTAEFRETGENSLFAVEAFGVPTVTINGNVFAKMG